ncbi:MAG: hypothetical protein IPQ19_15290 [Bacteroidetes bacterium]|nr:hypothetical protein [Bacteroidota bacterium]
MEVIWKEIIQFEKNRTILWYWCPVEVIILKISSLIFTFQFWVLISIFPFNFDQIGYYLEDVIDFYTFRKEFRNGHIINSFHNTFLNIPRYLKYFKELLIEKGLENIKKLGRNQIIEYVIYKRIQIEHDKLKSKRKGGSYNIEFIIQILERIALIMEMQEENVISRENFYQFS